MNNSENVDNNLEQNSTLYSFNNQNEFNSNNNINKVNKSKKLFIILGIIIAAIIVIFVFFNKGKNSNREVDFGETLKIYEMKGKYDFDFQVLDIEKDYFISNSIFYTGQCYALKVKIRNNSSKNLDLYSLIYFTLLDSEGQKIESNNLLVTSNFDGSLKLNIPSDTTDTGYLYFYHFDENGKNSNIDASRVDKLKISVIKKLYSDNGMSKGEYNDYYVKLR